jgi:glutaredoxin 3
MNITIYSMDGCGHCVGAKAALTLKNIDFTEVKVPHDMTTADFVEKFPMARSMPLIFDDTHLIGGLQELQSYLLSKELEGVTI